MNAMPSFEGGADLKVSAQADLGMQFGLERGRFMKSLYVCTSSYSILLVVAVLVYPCGRM